MVGRSGMLHAVGVGECRAVRDGGDLVAVDGEACAQALAGHLRHHDHLIGQCHHRFEHRTLVWCRIFEHRVSDDDRRDAQTGHDLDDFVSVGTAIDAVLVLDDGDVALVEELGGCRYGRSRAVDELADDVGLLGDVTVGDAHDVDVGASGCQSVRQGRAKGRQAARCRRVGAEDAKARHVRKVLHPKGSNQWLKQRWSIQNYPDCTVNRCVRRERMLGQISVRS